MGYSVNFIYYLYKKDYKKSDTAIETFIINNYFFVHRFCLFKKLMILQYTIQCSLLKHS
jgi:hypothetical protein